MPNQYVVLLVCVVTATSAIAQSNGLTPSELTESEIALLRICDEMESARDAHHSHLDTLDDDAARKYAVENDPFVSSTAKLIRFERAHHGMPSGLMAARVLVMFGAGGGVPGNPRDLGRRQALAALEDYAAVPELADVLWWLRGGNTEPQIEQLLRQLMNADGTTAQNRAYARFMLAVWVFKERDNRNHLQQRIREMTEGAPERYNGEREDFEVKLEHSLPPGALVELEEEAVDILESLAKSHPGMRQPAVSNADERGYIVRFDPEKTSEMPRIRDLAAALLFKEQHLRVGRPAPALQLQLVSGDKWSLADERGKVVIIQFGYKGCGPCEAMYPDLRAMADQYRGKLCIVTITADDKLQDTMESIEAGKMTWNVSWDGENGPLATGWAVDSFPAVFVVDPNGEIAATGLRGEPLRTKVAELVR